MTSAVGAVIGGVDLREPLGPDVVRALRQALLEHGVIFFHGQELTRDQMHAFVTNFGTPIPEPFSSGGKSEVVSENDLLGARRATSVWHSDTTYVTEPPSLTALRAVSLPPVGGDTCWGSMYAAYDALSAPLRGMLDGLTAVHSVFPVIERMGQSGTEHANHSASSHGLEHVHPVIRVHPETGRKALFVSEGWTTRIVELTPAESAHLLALLFEHVKSPDFTMRHRWAPNDVAMWDNRAVQHYAVPDYGSTRVMQRVVLAGDRPYGPS
ncbi:MULTISPECIES: TauD/TfdA family dioxygenase [unclassified Pseudofrankia]|uniref:TauD/TfdA dioxygenase family protein n=1 Tax=unclassified Pseudofrankia TaxID=2994372 RepID=UPI001F5240EE|nr:MULTISPECIES: TauD/TfdA family dioxygenase [unclassified Pseudofrankia]MDT3445792.1 TauD/TfdA family dioxygenase [Pseudofrankia sp. BMG5.37]